MPEKKKELNLLVQVLADEKVVPHLQGKESKAMERLGDAVLKLALVEELQKREIIDIEVAQLIYCSTL